MATCVLSASAYWLMTHRSEVEGRLGRRVKAYTDFDTFYHNLYLYVLVHQQQQQQGPGAVGSGVGLAAVWP